MMGYGRGNHEGCRKVAEFRAEVRHGAEAQLRAETDRICGGSRSRTELPTAKALQRLPVCVGSHSVWSCRGHGTDLLHGAIERLADAVWTVCGSERVQSRKLVAGDLGHLADSLLELAHVGLFREV